MSKKYKNKYRNGSARWQVWDYAKPGAYFITTCTKDRKHFFGKIESGKMILNRIGLIAYQCWAELPNHFTDIELGEFVIMPDHVHGIIIIGNGRIRACPDPTITDCPDPTITNCPDPTITNCPDPTITNCPDHTITNCPDHTITDCPDHTITPGKKRFRNQGKNTISAMVGSFKSAVSRLSHAVDPDFGWQSRFHDHVIRSDDAINKISNYIKSNPEKWDSK